MTSITTLALLVEFTWSGGSARHARWETDLTSNGQVYAATPALDVSDLQLDGAADDRPVTVSIAADSTLVTTFLGQTMPPITCRIMECDPASPNTVTELWAGEVQQIVANAAGQSLLARITVGGWKSVLQLPMGIVASSRCQWAFGDAQCGKSLAAITESVTVAEIGYNGYPNYVRITGTQAHAAGYWKWGQLSTGGLALNVESEETHSGNLWLALSAVPPASWASSTASLIPGCSKSLAACRAWSNEQRFGGIGIRMPSRNALMEE